MKKLNHLISLITILGLTCGIGFTQTITKPKAQNRAPQQAVTPAATSNPVTGSGMVGRIAKWTGVDGTNSFSIGNTNIFEDKFGKVGIGTTAPTSLLTVQGMLETTLGGYKFPDGTIQTTAAVTGLQSVFHDTSLTGNGTSNSPLAISVFHNLTLTGIGTSSSPLSVAIPLELTGTPGKSIAVIAVTNMSAGGSGMLATGGPPDSTQGGEGVRTFGGSSQTTAGGGIGLNSFGGDSTNGSGGNAGNFNGGLGGAGNGGHGVFAIGGVGVGTGKQGGSGIVAFLGAFSGGATVGFAGEFLGDVRIAGDLNVSGTKNFRIDHPLDPENKYLVHAAIESSEVLNIYSGNITTDANGEASVSLPDWFEAVNKDTRYQLTVVGTFAQAIIGEKIKHNRFTIKTNAPNVEVSWQVTGVRSDAGLLKRPFKTEEMKPEQERGTYLDPAAYNQPEERGTQWARHPEIMQQIKQTREKQIEELKQKAQQVQK